MIILSINMYIFTFPVAMEFDEFIDEIGGFGRLQRLYFLIIRLVEISGAFGVMITVFIGATPRWRCNRFEGLDLEYSATTNLTSMSGINESLILNDTLYQCQRDDHQCVEFQFLDEHPSVVSEVSDMYPFTIIYVFKQCYISKLN